MRLAVTAAVGTDGVLTDVAVYGILSLIFSALFIVITLKYIAFLLRADNNGEGGTLSLTALVFRMLGRGAPFALIQRSGYLVREREMPHPREKGPWFQMRLARGMSTLQSQRLLVILRWRLRP